MQRNLTLAAVLLLIAIGVAMWLLLAKPVRIDDSLSGPQAEDRLAWPDLRLDLNTASVEELTILPGIGPAFAERIVAFRRERGRIDSICQLLDVPGIGEARLEAILPYVVVEADE